MGACQTRERGSKQKGLKAPPKSDPSSAPSIRPQITSLFRLGRRGKKKAASRAQAQSQAAQHRYNGSQGQFIRACEHGSVSWARGFTGDVNAAAPSKETALTAAARRGQGKVVEVLVRERGARLDQPDGWGYLPLDRAVAHGRMDLVVRMVGLGADLSASNLFGWTALMYAGDRPPMVTLLVKSLGVNPNPTATRLKFQPVSGDQGSLEALCRAGWESGVEVDLNCPHSTVWRPRSQAKKWVSPRRQKE